MKKSTDGFPGGRIPGGSSRDHAGRGDGAERNQTVTAGSGNSSSLSFDANNHINSGGGAAVLVLRCVVAARYGRGEQGADVAQRNPRTSALLGLLESFATALALPSPSGLRFADAPSRGHSGLAFCVCNHTGQRSQACAADARSLRNRTRHLFRFRAAFSLRRVAPREPQRRRHVD
jgi:hypothetical protein